MTQREEDVPFCCRVAMLGDFEPGHEWDRRYFKLDKEVQRRIRNDIIGHMDDFKWIDPEDEEWGEDGRPATVICNTTSIQKNASAVLKKLGFIAACKARVPGSRHTITTWVFPMDKWQVGKFKKEKLIEINKPFKGF